MTMLFKTLAAIAGWTAICSSALTASTDRIEHHVAKIDGTRFHYVTPEAAILCCCFPVGQRAGSLGARSCLCWSARTVWS